MVNRHKGHPDFFQCLWIRNRFFNFWIRTGAIVMLIYAGKTLVPAFQFTIWGAIKFAAAMIASTGIGALLALLSLATFGRLIILPIERYNGAPFDLGDEIVILSGPYQGKSARIYWVGSERHEVSVEIIDAESHLLVREHYPYTDIGRRPHG